MLASMRDRWHDALDGQFRVLKTCVIKARGDTLDWLADLLTYDNIDCFFSKIIENFKNPFSDIM